MYDYVHAAAAHPVNYSTIPSTRGVFEHGNETSEYELLINPLKLNVLKKRRTAQLTFRYCILYIYSTNIRTEYFKHAA